MWATRTFVAQFNDLLLCQSWKGLYDLLGLAMMKAVRNPLCSVLESAWYAHLEVSSVVEWPGY